MTLDICLYIFAAIRWTYDMYPWNINHWNIILFQAISIFRFWQLNVGFRLNNKNIHCRIDTAPRLNSSVSQPAHMALMMNKTNVHLLDWNRFSICAIIFTEAYPTSNIICVVHQYIQYNDERTERYSIRNEHVKYLLVKLQTWKLFNKIAYIHLTLEYERGKYCHKTCSFF